MTRTLVEAELLLEMAHLDSQSARNDGRPRVALTRGSDVRPIPIDWLWLGWLAAGKLHLIAGAPGTGKTTIAASLAAVLSSGGSWPDGSPAKAGNVVIWSGEDDYADTLSPRLRAAGADMRRIHFIQGMVAGERQYGFDPSRDIDALRNELCTIPDVRMVLIDPLVAAVSGDSHKNAEVRRSLQPLVDLSHDIGCALVGVTHLSKGTAGRDPLERVTGSVAFGALARLAMMTARQEANGEHPERRILVRAKSNYGPDGGGFIYNLNQVELDGFPGVVTSTVQWGPPITGSARELTDFDDEVSNRRTAVDTAMHWLRKTLEVGPMPAGEVEKLAETAGISHKTLRTARERIGVRSDREGFGPGSVITWALPDIHARPAP